MEESNGKLAKKNVATDFLLYTSPDGEIRVEAFLHRENIWLTQKRMAELFDVKIPTINEHLKNAYASHELEEKATIRNFLIVQKEGQRKVSREVEFYNLDAILSVGYRVNSRQATHFRIWASRILKEYIIKGFAMDDQRLKNGRYFGKDYFEELLERVRSIRASERRIYLKITDVFAECSLDYDPRSPITKEFYATVQNKFHYAITGQTAAERIYHAAGQAKPHMGLTTWKNAPKGRILKSDTAVAKNYLPENEIKKLERTISSYFDYLENQIEKRKTFKMAELAESVNKFLQFNDFKVLDGSGTVSHQQAEAKAAAEYEKFNKIQPIDSDFEKQIKSLRA